MTHETDCLTLKVTAVEAIVRNMETAAKGARLACEAHLRLLDELERLGVLDAAQIAESRATMTPLQQMFTDMETTTVPLIGALRMMSAATRAQMASGSERIQ